MFLRLVGPGWNRYCLSLPSKPIDGLTDSWAKSAFLRLAERPGQCLSLTFAVDQVSWREHIWTGWTTRLILIVTATSSCIIHTREAPINSHDVDGVPASKRDHSISAPRGKLHSDSLSILQ
ncbi:hypothetical protein BDR05DRAFT_970312 [Suillus weaverae]|nr:hypothetical protein BDR05DRAFT_970312 [Suillus weaverae]